MELGNKRKRVTDRQEDGNGLIVYTGNVRDPLTPEMGKKKKWRDSLQECWSPATLERGPSLTTQVVPQIYTDGGKEEREVCQDDDPQTPRGQMIKVPTEPPPLKPVLPLLGGDGCAVEPSNINSSPHILGSSVSRWL